MAQAGWRGANSDARRRAGGHSFGRADSTRNARRAASETYQSDKAAANAGTGAAVGAADRRVGERGSGFGTAAFRFYGAGRSFAAFEFAGNAARCLSSGYARVGGSGAAD